MRWFRGLLLCLFFSTPAFCWESVVGPDGLIYENVDYSGAGRHGSVYAVRERKTQNLFALKLYHGNVSVGFQHRELQGYERAKTLQDATSYARHFPVIYLTGRFTGPDWVRDGALQEFIVGEPMNDIIDAKPDFHSPQFGEYLAEFCKIIRDVWNATSHLAKLGFFIGDLHPRNILIQPERAVLIDLDAFGKRGFFSGPPRTIECLKPPEFLRGGVTTVSDLFIFGKTLDATMGDYLRSALRRSAVAESSRKQIESILQFIDDSTIADSRARFRALRKWNLQYAALGSDREFARRFAPSPIERILARCGLQKRSTPR